MKAVLPESLPTALAGSGEGQAATRDRKSRGQILVGSFDVPMGIGRKSLSACVKRAGIGAGFASLLVLVGAGSVKDATAVGETRTRLLLRDLGFRVRSRGEAPPP